jgi:hypothetical protein
MSGRIGGTHRLTIDGKGVLVVGDMNFNLGRAKREMKLGNDKVHGYTEMPQVPFIDGNIRNDGSLKVDDILGVVNSTIQLEHANGKTYLFEKAAYCGDGDMTTEEGTLQFRIEAERAEEVK